MQKVVDSLDDIYALQDPLVDLDVLRDILRDDRLHMLLQVDCVSDCRILHNPPLNVSSSLLFSVC